jgi:lipoate-protein ligase A
MKILDLTFGTPAEDLACDEALFASLRGTDEGLLRFWEPAQLFVVLGYSRKWQSDINLDYCLKERIPILRRISGGGTVLQGPGCLNFSLLLKTDGAHPLSTIAKANEYILKRHQRAIEAATGRKILIRGTSDLTIGEMKFSGNSQRREKDRILFQGSFLVAADFQTIEKTLKVPDRQPSYRRGRPHSEFLINLEVDARRIKQAIADEWKATSPLKKVPAEKILALARTKYSSDEWNLKF